MSGWEMVVGLEVHVQLLTETKLFCNCSTQFGDPPNRNTKRTPLICPPPSSAETSPSGAYPVPPRLTRPLAVTTARTVISFFVSVPVLSEAMTLAEPSVSTAAR